MPTREQLDEAHEVSQKEAFKLLNPYFTGTSFFPLLEGDEDYSRRFKSQWTRAFNAVNADIKRANAQNARQ